MAASRIHKISSVFERISGLVETGVITPLDKPIWFDVYKYHPPKYNFSFDRPALKVEVKPILYEEDVLRAKIHKMKTDVFDLNNNYKESTTKVCQEIMKDGMTLNEAIKKINEKEMKVGIKKITQESTIFEDLEFIRD